MKKNVSPSGFSLVEIALALGVAMVALVSVIGLLRVAIQSDSDAGRDTTLVAMSNHILNELRATNFDSLWNEDPQNQRTNVPSVAAPPPSRYYFDVEGTPIADDDAPNNVNTVYECVVHKTPDELTRNRGNGPYNKLNLRLEFTWPYTPGTTPEQRHNRLNNNASIARY